MNPFKKMTLYSKILILILLLTLGATLFSTVIIMSYDTPQYRSMITLFNDILDQSSFISSAILDKNLEKAKKHLTKIQNHKDVLSADIHSADTQNIYPKNINSTQKSTLYPFSTYFDQNIDLTYPIRKQDKIIGTLQIKAINTTDYFYSLLEILGLIIVVVMIITAYFSKRLTKPLFRLAHAMNVVTTQGNFSIRLKEKIGKGDEIEQLIKTFNQMLDKIQLDEKNQHIAKEQIQKLSFYDALTGLPKRERFSEELEKVLINAAHASETVAIMCLGLDQFNLINNRFGHIQGDQLLQKIVVLIQGYLKTEAIYFPNLARLSSDEFAISLQNITHLETVETIAKQLIAIINRTYLINNENVLLSTSIGIALYPKQGEHSTMLIKHASISMHHARELGKGQYQLYETQMGEAVEKFVKLENELRNALKNQELLIYYQPKYNIRTQKISGLEALLRWKHPNLGIVSPDDFIPIAEQSGLIIDIGAWILLEGAKQCQRWHDAGFSDLKISINLSPLQFTDPQLIKKLKEALTLANLKPSFLELEITESMIMIGDDNTFNLIKELKEIGVQLSIDDFGTGYSSLHYLTKHPVDTIKIDKSFVTYLIENQNNAMVTKAIIDLSHNLGFNVIAEGVETIEQFRFLQAEGCDEIQGYLLSKPITSLEMDHFLEKHKQPFFL